MKFSWRRLQTFNLVADGYLARQPNETKMRYAIERVKKQIAAYQSRIQTIVTDIEIDTCVVDDKGVIQRDASGNLQFTRESIKERNKLQQEFLDREDFEIEPYLCTKPAELLPDEAEAFAGLILAEKKFVVAPPTPTPGQMPMSG